MGKEKKILKRARGRPAGREFTHMAKIPMRPAAWAHLQRVAKGEEKSAAEIIRGLVDRYLKRHPVD